MDIDRILVIPSRWTHNATWNSTSDYTFPGAIVETVPLDVYCIHLGYRTDRMQHIERLRAAYPSFRIHIVDAVQHADGNTGCIRSHKKVIEDAKARKLPYTIVIEDDCQFLLPDKRLFDVFVTVISYCHSHPEIDAVNGCGNLPVLTATRVDSMGDTTFLKAPNVRTTHCILYTLAAYDKIAAFPEIGAIIDVQTNSLNMVFTYPYLATQIPSYSDIMGRDVEYENIEKSRAFVQNVLEGRPAQEIFDQRINPLRVFRIPIRTKRM